MYMYGTLPPGSIPEVITGTATAVNLVGPSFKEPTRLVYFSDGSRLGSRLSYLTPEQAELIKLRMQPRGVVPVGRVDT